MPTIWCIGTVLTWTRPGTGLRWARPPARSGPVTMPVTGGRSSTRTGRRSTRCGWSEREHLCQKKRRPCGRLPGRCGGTGDLCHRLFEVLVDLVEEARGREPLLLGTDQQRQVLGHEARLHG